ncbi:endonuclease/exonuclease/phosphatase family protein [Limimaricola soesokkakensis]|uniref:endonuclease/exonuclease/phosphatase family protein n=1 Tax=Limimaricola soesokkakensis TaxID=1343159 RepID=UPI003513F5B3
MKYVVAVLLVFATIGLSLASFGALIESNIWWLRMTDFPRLQYLIGLVVVLLLIAVAKPVGAKLRLGLAALALLAVGYNTVKLFPYFTPNGSLELACEDDQEFVVMVANVKKGNRSADGLIQLVEEHGPDLFLALETDEWWDTQLAVLDSEMPHKAQRITGGFFGVHLFSRLPLSGTEVIFPVEQDAPAILTDVELPSGSAIRFMGLHPRPPHPGQPSTGRDAQLMWAALRAREGDLPALIAGDLNAVPWEASIERLQRIGGFVDPREAYGYHATYDAQSWWMSWPLDHVLHQSDLSVGSLKVLPDFGSDHYPIKVTLCNAPTGMGPPQMQSGDIEEAEHDIELALKSADERQ